MNKQAKGKHWQITTFIHELNDHYTVDPFVIKFQPIEKQDELDYWVGQIEICPETQREHMHIHLYFKEDKRTTQLRNWLLDVGLGDSHFEKVKDFKASIKYCSKDESRKTGPFFSEKAPKAGAAVQGARSDLYQVCDDIKKGKCLKQVAEDNSELFVRNHRGLEALCGYIQKPPERPEMDTICLYGPPGTGKTTLAKDIAIAILGSTDDIYYKPSGLWWSNYTNEKGVIIDDLAASGEANQSVKNMLDKTPCTVQVKNGFRNLHTKLFIITSNTDPRNWYAESALDDRRAVLRRMMIWKVPEKLFDETTMAGTPAREALLQECINAYNAKSVTHARRGWDNLDRNEPIFVQQAQNYPIFNS